MRVKCWGDSVTGIPEHVQWEGMYLCVYVAQPLRYSTTTITTASSRHSLQRLHTEYVFIFSWQTLILGYTAVRGEWQWFNIGSQGGWGGTRRSAAGTSSGIKPSSTCCCAPLSSKSRVSTLRWRECFCTVDGNTFSPQTQDNIISKCLTYVLQAQSDWFTYYLICL